MSDVFDLAQIEEQTFIANVDFNEQISSTNDRAIALIKSSSIESSIETPLLVLTENQTAGRGQGDRRWFAGRESLTCSICFSVAQSQTLDSEILPLLPLSTGLAVCNTIDSLCQDVNVDLAEPKKPSIKWPNDVLIGDRKVCGILIEQIVCDSNTFNVIGIGINVNQGIELAESIARADSDRDVGQSNNQAGTVPVSLKTVFGTELDLNQVLIRLLQQLQRRMQIDHSTSASEIAKSVENRLWRNGQPVCVDLPAKKILRGNCVGLTSNGALLIDTGERIESVLSGRIRLN